MLQLVFWLDWSLKYQQTLSIFYQSGSRNGDRLLAGKENKNVEEVTELKDQIIGVIGYSDD